MSYLKRVTRVPWTPALENNLWHAVVVDGDGPNPVVVVSRRTAGLHP